MNPAPKIAPKVQALLEHSDGIRCMAFSPCNKYLVSVGTVHDQCIIVYKNTQKNGWTKLAAAKFKDIIDSVIWSKRRIITVGRRHLRVWEWDEKSVLLFIIELIKSSGEVYVLTNRSVLYSHLGDDADFYAAAAMGGDAVAVASRTGLIYSLNASSREIRMVCDIGREISCLGWDKARNLLWIGGDHGSLGYFSLFFII